MDKEMLVLLTCSRRLAGILMSVLGVLSTSSTLHAYPVTVTGYVVGDPECIADTIIRFPGNATVSPDWVYLSPSGFFHVTAEYGTTVTAVADSRYRCTFTSDVATAGFGDLLLITHYYPTTVSGRVVAEDGVTPMPGVQVVLSVDRTIVDVTDGNGEYSFPYPNGNNTLLFHRSFHHAVRQGFETYTYGPDVHLPDAVMYGDEPAYVDYGETSWDTKFAWELCPDEDPSFISVWVDFDDDYMSTEVGAGDVRLDLGDFAPGSPPVSSNNALNVGNGYVANFTVPLSAYCARGDLTVQYATKPGPTIAWNDLASHVHNVARYDIIADGALDLGDIGAFALANGSAEGDPNYNPCADYDGDGTIGLADLGSFAAALTGNRCSASQARPGEPGGLSAPSGRLALSPARPNPFRDRVTFEYAVPADRSGVAMVYDVSGRHVRTLANESRGRGTLSWDGRDSAGQRLASGIYFVRLQLGQEKITRKVTLLD
ncbi:MAG: FlgD immunoglobulin-like domain containing protein [bacterium]